MRIFVSAGEPSGDVHGANLIRALCDRRPAIETVGFGGDRMTEAGCKHLFPLADHAVMGFVRVFANLPKYIDLIWQADRYLHHRRPDAVVLIDCPAFNWWIARRAKFHRIPVFYFVPPQIWAWAGWRVKKMRRDVDHVLCSLPFEVPWYEERGVHAEYVGHPFFDEVPGQVLDSAFLAEQHQQGGTIIGILPGSRTMEVQKNFHSQLRAAARIHEARPDTRFLVACYKRGQQKIAEEIRRSFASLPVQTFVQRTPEIIEASKMCMAVSGSVSLELLYRCKPTVIGYRTSKMAEFFLRPMITAKYITLVNLLADRVLFPEYASERCEAPALADAILHWLNDDRAYAQICAELLALREKSAQPGACARAAERVLEVIEGQAARAA